jgi:hypothetical protein
LQKILNLIQIAWTFWWLFPQPADFNDLCKLFDLFEHYFFAGVRTVMSGNETKHWKVVRCILNVVQLAQLRFFFNTFNKMLDRFIG